MTVGDTTREAAVADGMIGIIRKATIAGGMGGKPGMGVKPGMGGKMMGGKVGQATKKLQETMLSNLLKVVLLMVRSFGNRG